jgi:uncharacterized protein YggE
MQNRFSVAAIALTFFASPVSAQTLLPAISVTGEGVISVAPDQAQIDAGVTSEGKTAREASDANNAAMGKVMLALKGAGIEEKDYQTSRLSLQPKYLPDRAGSSTVAGYHASNRVTVKLRDVTRTAAMIDILVGAGANEIGGINFMASQASKLTDEAREKAMTDARRKAELYAKAAGVTLGEALSISEEASTMPTFRGKMAAPMAAGAPIAQGEETLSVTVNVSWAIKAAK